MDFKVDEFNSYNSYSSRASTAFESPKLKAPEGFSDLHSFSVKQEVQDAYLSSDSSSGCNTPSVFYRLYPYRETVPLYKIKYSEFSIPYRLNKSSEGIQICLFTPNYKKGDFTIDFIPNQNTVEPKDKRTIGTVVVCGFAEYHNSVEPFNGLCVKNLCSLEDIDFCIKEDKFVIFVPKRGHKPCDSHALNEPIETLPLLINRKKSAMNDCHDDAWSQHQTHNLVRKEDGLQSSPLNHFPHIPLHLILGTMLLAVLVLIYWFHCFIQLISQFSISSTFSTTYNKIFATNCTDTASGCKT
ncbi:hypothetical protein BB561_000856 [Smittium simulii]|uniref:Uncharacterized protein n=1 Tax=Smittium simulii TaxID=133385 RepID=A0A2T9YX90_9FUNG|nr:hypothetical protein BB561_000856 [Smittium simulii]